MSIAANVEARIQSVTITDDEISAQLVDGRNITVPLARISHRYLAKGRPSWHN
jgi:hypothetical protein